MQIFGAKPNKKTWKSFVNFMIITMAGVKEGKETRYTEDLCGLRITWRKEGQKGKKRWVGHCEELKIPVKEESNPHRQTSKYQIRSHLWVSTKEASYLIYVFNHLVSLSFKNMNDFHCVSDIK